LDLVDNVLHALLDVINVSELTLNRNEFPEFKFHEKTLHGVENLSEIPNDAVVSGIFIPALTPIEINPVGLELNELIILFVYEPNPRQRRTSGRINQELVNILRNWGCMFDSGILFSKFRPEQTKVSNIKISRRLEPNPANNFVDWRVFVAREPVPRAGPIITEWVFNHVDKI
jgi:hypothetical protein